MPWGGARPGSGPKRGREKQLARETGEIAAQRILEKLGWEEQIIYIYQNCGDAKTKIQILLALQERAWGKPAQSKPKKVDPNGSQGTFGFERLEQLLSAAVRKTSRTLPEGDPN